MIRMKIVDIGYPYSNSSKLRLAFMLCFLLSLSVSCNNDEYDYLRSGPFNENSGGEQRGSPGFISFSISQFADNSISHQSAAAYHDYCVMVTKGRSSLSLYKQLLCTLPLKPNYDYDYLGNDLYHCNQASFGHFFYDPKDALPLLYISQRAQEDRRCFVEVFRLIPSKEDNESDFTSMTATLVQTIYFPAMTADNSLGNVNCTIDTTYRKIYTYSRDNQVGNVNYGYCKISCFNVPSTGNDVIYFNDTDILSSFMLDCSAINMQGGCIHKGILYIGQGYANAGYIYLNVINLDKKILQSRIDLLERGISWEPEGCFIYMDNLMITSGSDIWAFHL